MAFLRQRYHLVGSHDLVITEVPFADCNHGLITIEIPFGDYSWPYYNKGTIGLVTTEVPFGD